MAEKTEKNPRGAGRKKTRKPGKEYLIYLSDDVYAKIKPLAKDRGLGQAIETLLENVDAVAVQNLEDLREARRKLDAIQGILNE